MKEPNNGKSVLLMFYGESEVGKTETGKFSGLILGGSIMRAQMSMFQSNSYLDYLVGSKHNNKSFSRNLLNIKTNIVLFSNLNYDVNLKYIIFIIFFNFY